MRIGTWEPTVRPSSGWQGVRRPPRLAVEPSLTGAVAHVQPGHVSDEILTLEWEALDSRPAIAISATNPDYLAMPLFYTIGPGERIAVPIGSGAMWDFDAVAAVRMRLLQSLGSETGYITAEIWQAGLTDRVGVFGSFWANTVGWPAGVGVPMWGHTAYPIAHDVTLPQSGYLVLCGDELTSGTIRWGVLPGGGPTCYKYTGGVWVPFAATFCYTIYTCGQYCEMLGLQAAFGGGHLYDIWLDDGQRYQGYIAEVIGRNTAVPQWGAIPLPYGELPAVGGAVATDVRMTLQLVRELQ